MLYIKLFLNVFCLLNRLSSLFVARDDSFITMAYIVHTIFDRIYYWGALDSSISSYPHQMQYWQATLEVAELINIMALKNKLYIALQVLFLNE